MKLKLNFEFNSQEAWTHVLSCSTKMRPNRGFVEQLSRWEEQVLGEKKTDISDPDFWSDVEKLKVLFDNGR